MASNQIFASRRRAAAPLGPLLVLLLGLAAAFALLGGSAFAGPRGGRSAAAGPPASSAALSPSLRRQLQPLAARGGDDDDFEYNQASYTMRHLKQGQKVSGVVTKTMGFGAFVDIGAEKEGLVPLGKMANERVENVEDHVKAGDGVEVWVADVTIVEDGSGINLRESKILLSMVKNKVFGGGARGGARADLSLFENLSQDEWLKGTVVNIQGFGAFVQVSAPGSTEVAQGLVHISQIAEGMVSSVADEVEMGQEVKVRVVSVDVSGNKLGLSMKQPGAGGGGKADADLSLFENVPQDEWLQGKVVNIQGFGAFVQVSPPGSEEFAQGLVHISQISDRMVDSVADEVEMGQEVQVRVISVDVSGNKLGLSMKPSGGGGGGGGGGAKADVSAFAGFAEKDEWLDGKVKSLTNFGAFVEIATPEGQVADGLVHISQIREGMVEDPGEELEIDQEVKVRVLSAADGKLSLSMKQMVA